VASAGGSDESDLPRTASNGRPGSGSIVNISSTYGHKAAASAAAYVSSKFAVEGLTKTVELEQGNSGIRVNAVGPGPTDTVMLDRFTGTSEGNDALIDGAYAPQGHS
jgi:NAD(P)-dependent dehydrogenase (short-subunit alcohol dehydrogenase family)